jgi:hypothetical protein
MSQNPFSDAPFNPYQAPMAPSVAPFSPTGNPYEAGVWRQGNLLVMHKMARLPDRCVKTNDPTAERLNRKLSWHHPAIYLALLFNIIIYVVLASVLRHQAAIQIGLGPEGLAWRRKVIAISWSGIIASIAAFIAAFQFDPDVSPQIFVPLLLGGIFGTLGFAIFGLTCARVVAAKRIDHHYVWLKGVCPDYLNQLPEFPYPPQ